MGWSPTPRRPAPCASPPERDDSKTCEPSGATEPARASSSAPSHAAPSLASASPVVELGPTTISIKHWGRLKDGLLLATSPRVDWRTLMERTFGFDSLACPKCQRRMRVVATILDPSAANRLLDHLGVRREPRTIAPARAPPWEQRDLGFG